MADVRQRAHRNVDKMMDRAEDMEHRAEQGVHSMKEKVHDMRMKADNYIKHNPEKSVLIAAGIGAALGAILTGAMMRRRA